MSHYANIFQMLMRLRQACDHPYLVLTRDRDTTVPDTFLGDVEQARCKFAPSLRSPPGRRFVLGRRFVHGR